MPVQINEIVVRTVVDTEPAGASKQQSDAADCGCASEELLERVLEIIQETKER